MWSKKAIMDLLFDMLGPVNTVIRNGRTIRNALTKGRKRIAAMIGM
jgi:hypothetical protein